MANVIRGNDTIRGTDVTFTIEIDGERHDFIFATQWETTADFNKDDVPRIGTRIVAKKNGTITLSGSCKCYYMDPRFRRIFVNFVKTGYWPEITATVRNYDQDSRAGAQTSVHKGIKFDSLTLSKFDAESTMLDEDLDFTFEEYLLPEEFDELPGTIF